MVKFLADENLAKDLVNSLKNMTEEVLWIRDSPHQGIDDESIIKLAIQENYVILKHDKGFGQLFYFQNRGQLSIIILEVIEPYPAESLQLLSNFIKQFSNFEQNIKDHCLIIVKRIKVRVIC